MKTNPVNIVANNNSFYAAFFIVFAIGTALAAYNSYLQIKLNKRKLEEPI